MHDSLMYNDASQPKSRISDTSNYCILQLVFRYCIVAVHIRVVVETF